MATTAATTTKKVAFGSLVNHLTECVGLSLPPTRVRLVSLTTSK
ncbi:hypothetical protein Tco_0070174, partial [Tanacetum coccineum]